MYIYYGNAAVYRSLRDSNKLVLPHPSYIRRLSLNVNTEPNIESNHLDYLRKRVSVLSDRERLVNVLLDEIHMKSGVSYKGGKITAGGSENTEGIANSIQAFIKTSLLSKKRCCRFIPDYLSFQEILVNYQKDFLQGSHQRQILVNCTYAYNADNFDMDETCSCTRSLGDLMQLPYLMPEVHSKHFI